MYSNAKERLKREGNPQVNAVASSVAEVETALVTVDALNQAVATLNLRHADLTKSLAVTEVLVREAVDYIDKLDAVQTRILLLLESKLEKTEE